MDASRSSPPAGPWAPARRIRPRPPAPGRSRRRRHPAVPRVPRRGTVKGWLGGGRPAATIRSADARAVALLLGLTALVAGNRFAFDAWLTRLDLHTFFLPWYAELGERLRGLEVPGWNPHLFAGAPFAGDPESGWTYLPAMLAFSLLPAVAAFKAMVAVQLGLAALSTYAFARVLGMGPPAGLVAAVLYAFGPFLHWNTQCCLIFGQFGTWVPLALLGVELAVRAGTRRDRVASWFVAGLAVSQMLAGWVGEGWLYALLLPAAYAGYRAVLAPPRPGLGARARLAGGAATVVAVSVAGLALGAAGVLPRLAFSAESNLADGYGRLGTSGVLNPPWRLDYLLVQVLGEGTGYHRRAVALGGAASVLAPLALVQGRRRFAAPFFAGLTVVSLTLALGTTPIHLPFSLLPRWREFHDHDAWRVTALAAIGPALLAGAAVEGLSAWRGRRHLLPLVVAPLALLLVAAVVLQRVEAFLGWPPLLAAAAATALLAAVVAVPRGSLRPRKPDRVTRWVPALLLAVAFAQPTGLELSGSWLGWPRDPFWAPTWQPHPALLPALARDVSRSDPGGAGEFLQNRLAADGPFRSVGYGGVGYPGDWARYDAYLGRRFDPFVGALPVNGRPMFLGLYDIQGYDPLQLDRYAEFVAALNGGPLNYHIAYLLPSGVRSPLLDLLSVRYVVVDASLPTWRDDVVALTAGRREVFRNGLVAVYERQPAPAHAWIVHDVRTVGRGWALPLLTDGAIDPRHTALVEGTPPPTGAVDPAAAATEWARVTRFEPERLTITARAAAPGLLVVSEIYASGWRAFVDGAPVDVLPTDHALRGVSIPAGEHTVELRYEPVELRLGLAIGGIATLGMVAAFAAAAWGRVGRPAAAFAKARAGGAGRIGGGTRRRDHGSAGMSPRWR